MGDLLYKVSPRDPAAFGLAFLVMTMSLARRKSAARRARHAYRPGAGITRQLGPFEEIGVGGPLRLARLVDEPPQHLRQCISTHTQQVFMPSAGDKVNLLRLVRLRKQPFRHPRWRQAIRCSGDNQKRREH